MGKFILEGVYSAMITPYDTDGNVNTAAAKGIVKFLKEKKANGVFPVSNVGEFLLLNADEKRRLVSAVTEENAGVLKVTPGICDVNTKSALEQARFCKDAGADAVVVCAPYYYPYPPEYVRRYMLEIAEHSVLPVIIYNSPSYTNKIDFEDLITLAAHENVRGIKESSGDVKFLLKLLNRIKNDGIDANVMLGWEELLYTGLTLGATGCAVSCGGIIPEILVKILDSFKKGDHATAVKYQMYVVEITSVIGQIGFPAGYKLAVKARGIDFNVIKDTGLVAYEDELTAKLPMLRDFINERVKGL